MEVSKCWNITEFPKISIKMKNWKTFYQVQTAIRFKEIIQPLPNPPSSDKILLRFWNRSFLTEICRNEQTFAFKGLQECGSWASINDAVQIFFLTPNGNMFAGKFLKSGLSWLCCGSILFSMSSELRSVKWVRFFEQNCIVKWVDWYFSLVFVGFETSCKKIWN